jgi:hypothetical protein
MTRSLASIVAGWRWLTAQPCPSARGAWSWRQGWPMGRWLLLLGLCIVTSASAHKPSDSYLGLDWHGASIQGQWDIHLRDLDSAIGLDSNADGQITWGEVRKRHAAMAAYALSRLTVSLNGQPCQAQAGEQQVDEHTDGAYTVLPLVLSCPGGTPPGAVPALTVEYRLFSDVDPSHRGLLRLTDDSGTRTAVLDPNGPAQSFAAGGGGHGSTVLQFLREGVWHIWIGFDHILFLLSLLLPAVLVWVRPRWVPVPRLRDALVDVAKIVTAFTLAHSITLTLATLQVVSLPSALVESAIAASVVLAALNNVLPVFHGRRWMVAFGFGLIHGFGFATVLGELQLPQGALVLALLAFNGGVELGQLAIVAVFLPLAFVLRATWFYRRIVLQAGSWAIAAVAAAWFIERAFSVQLLNLA